MPEVNPGTPKVGTEDNSVIKAEIQQALKFPAAVKTSLDPMKEAEVDDKKVDTALKKFYAKFFLWILS